MTERLAGKVAIVTGGTSGIGHTIVEAFRRHGATVVFTGRNAERGAKVAQATGGIFVAADAADPDHAERVVVRALEIAPHIDILVNNAGGPGHRGGVEKTSAMHLNESIAVHLSAPMLMTARAAPCMRTAGSGSVINICSVAGKRVGAPYLAYSVAKAALLQLTRCAAVELGRHKIRVNSVSPGFIATAIHTSCLDVDPARAEMIAGAMARMFVSRQALSRTGGPEEVAEAALFLASEESRFITGTDIVVDGGMMWGQYGLV
ncbi:MAG TPA: SDR family oxidoreductase [Xanthobacteraceae bacterium]|jgi:NAD(P)-dependent dehydrogenase (short-subunit alcohol dehydrogenase family)|nr:SDR family oxidoreductase [Xanthobacteraceae bacterium]